MSYDAFRIGNQRTRAGAILTKSTIDVEDCNHNFTHVYHIIQRYHELLLQSQIRCPSQRKQFAHA